MTQWGEMLALRSRAAARVPAADVSVGAVGDVPSTCVSVAHLADLMHFLTPGFSLTNALDAVIIWGTESAG